MSRRALAAAAVVALAGCPSARPTPATTPHPKGHGHARSGHADRDRGGGDAPRDRDVVRDRDEVVVDVLEGRAVWYGDDWQGKATASGERFDKRKLTAAHRTLKLGTRVRVTNTDNGKSVVVRINDRGPYGKDRRRIIDLSEAAARTLDFLDAGWCPVKVEVLGEDDEPDETEGR